MSEKPPLDQLIEQATLALLNQKGDDRQWSQLAGIVIEELITRGIVHVAIPNVEPGTRRRFPIARVYANLQGVCLEIDENVLTMLPSQVEAIAQAPQTAANELRDKLRALGSRRIDDPNEPEPTPKQPPQSSKSNKLRDLAELAGFKDTQELLEECSHDSVVLGICLEPGCSYVTDVEPDQANGWCEECQKNTVASCLVLAGII